MVVTQTGRALPSPSIGALRVLEALEAAGFEAWIVGGWVRDALRGTHGHDIDITSSAHWQEAERVLRAAGMAVHETGTAHGTITAVYANEPIEVTTYRTEGSYTDHRHPDEVRFVQNVREDLARRDFTINAMAWHPARGLLDPFGGLDDLSNGVIRAVGDPSRRFEEDALRILRAVRFSVRFGFTVEACAQRALEAHALDLCEVAQERIGSEIDAIVRMGRAGRALLEQPDVMCAALPELAAARGFDQRSVYHVYDVYEHTAHVCNGCQAFSAGQASPELQWAALLHDIAKPCTYSQDEVGHGHFFAHPTQGAAMARAIMRRFAIPGIVTDEACALIRMHDEQMPLTPRAIRRMLARLAQVSPGKEGALGFSLLNLRRSDAIAKRPSAASRAHELDAYSSLLRQELAHSKAYSLRQLAVTGADVMRVCTIPPGPGVGMQLEQLLSAVMDGSVRNEREELLRWLGDSDA